MDSYWSMNSGLHFKTSLFFLSYFLDFIHFKHSMLSVLLWLLPIVQSAEIKMFCKCFCGSNSTIFEIPTVDLKPCANCTKQFCLDNVKDGLCDGIADATCPSNDFKTACFGNKRSIALML